MAGIKEDQDKLRYDLIPLDALEEVVKVLGYGAKKRGERNWEEGIEYSRLYAATQRHLSSWFQYRQPNDLESNLPHLAHAACSILFLLAYELRNKKSPLDNRPSTYTQISSEEYLEQVKHRAALEKGVNIHAQGAWLVSQALKHVETPPTVPEEEQAEDWVLGLEPLPFPRQPLKSPESPEPSQSPLDSRSSDESSDAPQD